MIFPPSIHLAAGLRFSNGFGRHSKLARGTVASTALSGYVSERVHFRTCLFRTCPFPLTRLKYCAESRLTHYSLFCLQFVLKSEVFDLSRDAVSALVVKDSRGSSQN